MQRSYGGRLKLGKIKHIGCKGICWRSAARNKHKGEFYCGKCAKFLNCESVHEVNDMEIEMFDINPKPLEVFLPRYEPSRFDSYLTSEERGRLNKKEYNKRYRSKMTDATKRRYYENHKLKMILHMVDEIKYWVIHYG